MLRSSANTQVQTLFFLLVAYFFSALTLNGQNEEPSSTEMLENFFRDNEFASESDAQQFLEQLESMREHPVDLNRATREDLISMHLLGEVPIENFLAYRSRFGPLLNTYELQAVPGWDLADIRRVLPFVFVGTGIDQRNVSVWKGFYKGENEFLQRLGHTQDVGNSYYGDANTVEGGPYAVALRYRHNFDNRLRFGFTAESDPGEALFGKSNPQGFDFYSAHLFIQRANRRLKALALGDYSARMGQGLLLQTGFSPGKSAETVSIVRGGKKLNAYGAFGETFFFRGAATTLALGKNWEITALYSNRRRDANIQYPDSTDQEAADILFTSLQSSGYHRDSNEIADEKTLREQVAGLSATYQWRNGQISANGLYIGYDKPWNPSPSAYRQFTFRGKTLTGGSIDYHFRYRNFFFFGEGARSDNGGLATVNGLLLAAHKNVTLSILQRALAKDYQSIYANPFAESSGANNENGVYLGADIRWVRRWQLNFYADAWRHPWLRFGVSSPSRGREFLARIQWQKSKSFSAYLLWQSETKEQDNPEANATGLVENRRDRFRLHAVSKVNRSFEFRSRIEWTRYQIGRQAPTFGYMAYEEAVVKVFGSPVSGSLRYTIFDTEDYDTRVYTFENDIFAAVSIPAFAGRGTRYYVNLQWNVNRWLRLEARFEQTNILRAVTDTGVSGKEHVWKLQARIKW